MASDSTHKVSRQLLESYLKLAVKYDLRSLKVQGLEFERDLRPKAIQPPKSESLQRSGEIESLEQMDERIGNGLKRFYGGAN